MQAWYKDGFLGDEFHQHRMKQGFFEAPATGVIALTSLIIIDAKGLNTFSIFSRVIVVVQSIIQLRQATISRHLLRVSEGEREEGHERIWRNFYAESHHIMEKPQADLYMPSLLMVAAGFCA